MEISLACYAETIGRDTQNLRPPWCKLARINRLPTFVLALLLPTASPAEDLPDGETLQQEGAIIGEVTLEKSNVFDLSDPEENNWLYRLANRMHIVTKDKVINKQLLFRPGDRYSSRLVDESERILRRNEYLFDADIAPVRYENGVVDLRVKTKEVWSLMPDIYVSRSGGETSSRIGIEDDNFLGLGQQINISHTEDVDRDSDRFEIADRHLGRSWVAARLKIEDNSDGKFNLLSATRPFYALDTRWSAGGTVFEDEHRTALYSLGDEAAEFQQDRDFYTAFGGWSRGLQGKWVRRWTAGFTYDDNDFSEVPDPTLPATIPEDRRLAYPFIGIDLLEDEFQVARNRDQIGKTEDFYMGTRVFASLGWADESFGSDRNALVFTARARRGIGSLDKNALLLSALSYGRIESGDARNAVLEASAHYYRKQSEKRLFFAKLSATKGHALDLDNPVQIGGDTGLRGYPLRYQTGDSKMLLTIEQRYFTDWYPFRFMRIGGAIFADAGRAWGTNPVGEENLGWLTNVGLGLRIAPTRFATLKIIHLDVAFPLDGDDSIDSVQVLLEAKRTF